jgi:hypothetical protein
MKFQWDKGLEMVTCLWVEHLFNIHQFLTNHLGLTVPPVTDAVVLCVMCINAYDSRPGDLSLAQEEQQPASDTICSDTICQGVLMSLDTSTTEPPASVRTTGGLDWWDWGRVGVGRKAVLLGQGAQGIVPGVELREPGVPRQPPWPPGSGGPHHGRSGRPQAASSPRCST